MAISFFVITHNPHLRLQVETLQLNLMYVIIADDDPETQEEAFIFEVSLEIRENANPSSTLAGVEKSASGGKAADTRQFDVVPRQKGIFKLKSNVEKKVVVSVHQVNSQNNSCKLGIERCFGMLVSPGRNVRHVDMQLIEHVTMATTKTSSSAESVASHASEQNEGICHIITGSWDPKESAFAVLNKETPSDVQSVYITIAADLIVTQVIIVSIMKYCSIDPIYIQNY